MQRQIRFARAQAVALPRPQAAVAMDRVLFVMAIAVLLVGLLAS